MTVVCAVMAAAGGGRPELLVWLLIAPISVLLAAVDLTVHRLPDVVVLPLTAAALAGLGGAALLPGADGSRRTALLGSLTLGACYLVVFLINPRGFGFGVGLILARRAGRKTSIPFGSFLLAGAFIGILVSSRAL
jgi:leader peptidase (prepilin peptidase)/N-methyltransferase